MNVSQRGSQRVRKQRKKELEVISRFTWRLSGGRQEAMTLISNRLHSLKKAKGKTTTLSYTRDYICMKQRIITHVLVLVLVLVSYL